MPRPVPPLLGALLAALLANPAPAVDLVKAGKPVATVVTESKAPPAVQPKGKGKAKAAAKPDADGQAAALVVEWVKKITDAELPVSDKAADGQPAIFIGKAAVKAGLKLDDIPSPSKEGVRIVVDGNRVLIGGQDDDSTLKAAARFLEHLGCRYYMDGPLGEVFPRTPTLAAEPVTITEKPDLLYRNPKGPSWSAAAWKAWNGAGGESFGHSHSWGGYIPKDAFDKHPEYFAQGADGKRKNGDWLCTSNPGAVEMFSEQVVARIKAGSKNPSISPPDGRGYCQCEKCKALDDPKAIEPSSGNVAVSNRYARFFDAVGRRVMKDCPDSILSFYVYADYTQAPTIDIKLSPNLCATVAPIRYCRLHPLGYEDCPSRKQQLEMMDGWAKRASHLGYYNYMYNLADVTLPMFKFTPCKTEFPYLVSKGLRYMTIEVVSNWYVYGPQMYLSLRMAYDPALNPDALMAEYYEKFYGPAAGPMKAYWTAIDEATTKLSCHSGGFYGLAAAYTPDLMRRCEVALAQAAAAAKGDPNPAYAARVAMHAGGYQNVPDYKAIEAHMAKGDFAAAKQQYDALLKRIDGLVAARQANSEYGTAYLRRFLAKGIDGPLPLTVAPNKVLGVLPDSWQFIADPADTGESRDFHSGKLDAVKWRPVATHSATLSRQGIDSNTVLWYRAEFTAPEKHGPLSLVFPEVDGRVGVWVNGKPLDAVSLLAPAKKAAAKAPAPAPGPAQPPRRAPFEVDVSAAVKPGGNVVVVRADNRTITELALGGILRPVLLVEKPAK